MPENMSDRMPEGLPVTNCINVMVGITRSKVIYSLFWDESCVYKQPYVYIYIYIQYIYNVYIYI